MDDAGWQQSELSTSHRTRRAGTFQMTYAVDGGRQIELVVPMTWVVDRDRQALVQFQSGEFGRAPDLDGIGRNAANPFALIVVC